MNELFNIMADDMGLMQYNNEPSECYAYRIIYSALGFWCLKSALSQKEGIKGISKHSQSILLHNLSEKYVQLFPATKKYLLESKEDIAVFIRNLYEQTGYLITLENNFNVLNNNAAAIKTTNGKNLYLGIPSEKCDMNGLGIYSQYLGNKISLQDFLIRDTLNPDDYVLINYNDCDFEERDIDPGELDFFDPYGTRSWSKHMTSKFSIARKGFSGPYYRVILDKNGNFLYKDENNTNDLKAFAGAEFRRLYIALRYYYNNPMQLIICQIDDAYSYLKLFGRLPNREYYYLLLNGWPKNGISDRTNFIVRNERIMQVKEVLGNLGFAIREDEFYG
ncbi:MAG: hypothetical protein K2O02_02525 [Lachnospiraceae bacterium]|nr:hypothetical protein [Lachnospiraceae bacterium]